MANNVLFLKTPFIHGSEKCVVFCTSALVVLFYIDWLEAFFVTSVYFFVIYFLVLQEYRSPIWDQ